MMSRREKIHSCAVAATVDVAGGKWKPVILFHLLSGTRRFGELKKLVVGVSQRSLTMQLRDLEEDGIIERHIFAEVPPRVEYSLTDFGRTLDPVLRAMSEWGNTFIARVSPTETYRAEAGFTEAARSEATIDNCIASLRPIDI